jgi:hypothetical protein
VQIGGEHEDYYDADLFIYNDVVLHYGRGGFEIYEYPREVFAPTDFHTATLGADGIYIVGSLGYPEQRRAGETPLYRLKLDSWEIEPVNTKGERPGWIRGHKARYDPARNAIRVAGGEIHVAAEGGKLKVVPNQERFELDISRLNWRRME